MKMWFKKIANPSPHGMLARPAIYCISRERKFNRSLINKTAKWLTACSIERVLIFYNSPVSHRDPMQKAP